MKTIWGPMMDLIQIRVKIQPLISLMVFLLVACGSDSGTESGPVQAETVYGLGECEKANEGVTKLVTSENQYYKCLNGDWRRIASPNQSNSSSVSEDGLDSSTSQGLSSSSEGNYEYSSGNDGSIYDASTNTLTDLRDEQSYRTVEIGNQVWMAENLNYATAGSFCYDDDITKCDKYGRLYLWSTAMDSAGIWSTNGKDCGGIKVCSPSLPVRGVCPQGWHLPSEKEFRTLFSAVGDHAETKLKSISGWERNDNGVDMYSFSALPAGCRVGEGKYDSEGRYTEFWSSTEESDYDVRVMHLMNYVMIYGDSEFIGRNSKTSGGSSVRCLKD